MSFKMEDDPELFNVAIKILDAFIADYKSEEHFRELEGPLISEQETEQFFNRYIEELGLQDFLTLKFTPHAVAQTSITHSGSSKKSKIIIQTPVDYTESRIWGTMHHEIGTHYLRRLNERKQVWFKNRTSYQMQDFLATEEGLACINQQLEHTLNGKYGRSTLRLKPYLFRQALYYWLCHMAKTRSFVEIFNALEKYISSPERRWKYVLRVKRGLTDTSQPGGFFKDQCYLKGAYTILRHRNIIDFKELYCGKIAVEDLVAISLEEKSVELVSPLNDLPSFMKDMDGYMAAIEEIAEVNLIPVLFD